MTRRDFVVAALALVGAWLTGQRVRWQRVFAESHRVVTQMHTAPTTLADLYFKVNSQLLAGLRHCTAEATWLAQMGVA